MAGAQADTYRIWIAEAVNQLKHLTTALSKGFNDMNATQSAARAQLF